MCVRLADLDSSMQHSASMFGYAKQDVVAGVVVFLVALPLCLGIAVACGVPPVSGLIAGIVGGLVVPLLSRSPLSVSGPAAGLTSISPDPRHRFRRFLGTEFVERANDVSQ